jgi:transposase InsO family protein
MLSSFFYDLPNWLRAKQLIIVCHSKLSTYEIRKFTVKKVNKWLKSMGVKTLFIEPGSPWENGYIESFNAHLRDEFLVREISLSIGELRYVVERWRMDYNHHRQQPWVYDTGGVCGRLHWA